MRLLTNKKTLAVVAAIAVVAAGLTFSQAYAEDVAATVNGDKILRKDVQAAMKNLPVQGADADKVFPMVLDQIINEKLFDAELAKAKVEDSDDYKKRLEAIRSQLAKQVYLEQYLKDKVTDSAVKSEYEKFKKENNGKEEIHARHIIVPTEEEAKQVIKDLDGGAKFDDLAKKRSSGPTAQNGGDLGYFTKQDMIPEFSNAAFQIKPGHYVQEPVKTQFGWHVIFVEDKRVRKVPEMKEVEAAIRNKLSQDSLAEMVRKLRTKADIKKFDEKGNPVPVEQPKG